MKIQTSFLRRTANAIIIAAFCLANASAQKEAAQLLVQTGFYRMKLGDAIVTAISDGTVPLNLKALLHDDNKGEVASLLRSDFLDTVAETSVTAFLVTLKGQAILIDAGSGNFMGASLGKVKSNLQAAGYQPGDITAVLLTHLHADHAGGLVDNGNRVFPNATIYISKAEADFWLTKSNEQTANKRAQPFFGAAQASIAPYGQAGKVKLFEPGTVLFDGIKPVAAYGHTPGETMYVLESNGEQLLFWGDVVHAAAVQFANADVTIEFDVNTAEAAAARKLVFDDAVKKGYWIASPHISFPVIGHLKKAVSGYEWIPVNYSTGF